MSHSATRLCQLREERGLTQVELARILRVSADMLLCGDIAGKQAIDIKNIRLYERFRAVDDLPKHEQETILRLVDAVLAKHRLEHLAYQTRTTV